MPKHSCLDWKTRKRLSRERANDGVRCKCLLHLTFRVTLALAYFTDVIHAMLPTKAVSTRIESVATWLMCWLWPRLYPKRLKA
jgi:hypothetical protein